MKDKSDNTNQFGQTPEKKADPVKATPKKTKNAVGPVALTLIAAVLVGGGAIWYIQNNQAQLSQQYGTQLNMIAQQSKKNEQIANEALALVRNQAQQLQHLKEEFSQTSDQLNDINVVVQTMSDSGSDLMLLNDIEQLVILAQQQLMIGGNLANGIVSLETAQARLAHANRQGLVTLQQTINGDLDRLRVVQVVDIATVTAQLDRLKELLNKAPLYVPDTKNSSINGNSSEPAPLTSSVAEESNVETEASTSPWWQRSLNSAVELTQKGWETIRHDLGQFVSVRRVEDSAALLMSTDQADRFRDNLSLRITMAQLALMTKQTQVWQTEMGHIITAIEQRYDPSVALTQRALALATKLADTDIDVKLPTLDNSLAAVEGLKQKGQNVLGAEVKSETKPEDSKEAETETDSDPEPATPTEAATEEPINTTQPNHTASQQGA